MNAEENHAVQHRKAMLLLMSSFTTLKKSFITTNDDSINNIEFEVITKVYLLFFVAWIVFGSGMVWNE